MKILILMLREETGLWGRGGPWRGVETLEFWNSRKSRRKISKDPKKNYLLYNYLLKYLSFSDFRILHLSVPYIFHGAKIRSVHHTRVTGLQHPVRTFLRRFIISVHGIIVLLFLWCPLLICLGICKRRQVREGIL